MVIDCEHIKSVRPNFFKDTFKETEIHERFFSAKLQQRGDQSILQGISVRRRINNLLEIKDAFLEDKTA